MFLTATAKRACFAPFWQLLGHGLGPIETFQTVSNLDFGHYAA
jgi:hypothetical protein